jgi:hypothetical protein
VAEPADTSSAPTVGAERDLDVVLNGPYSDAEVVDHLRCG